MIRRLRTRRVWTDAEVRLLVRLYPDTPTDRIARRLGRPVNRIHAKATALGLAKSARYMGTMLARVSQRLARAGAAHQFRPGHVTWNQGMKGWDAGGRSRETRFRRGHASTWDAEIYCVGALRVNSCGELEIKIGLGLRSWQTMRRFVWETEVGPIPRRMGVAAKNGDGHDTQLDNLELVTRAEMMRRNSLHRYPKAIVHSIQLLGVLHRQINRRTRDHGRQYTE